MPIAFRDEVIERRIVTQAAMNFQPGIGRPSRPVFDGEQLASGQTLFEPGLAFSSASSLVAPSAVHSGMPMTVAEKKPPSYPVRSRAPKC